MTKLATNNDSANNNPANTNLAKPRRTPKGNALDVPNAALAAALEAEFAAGIKPADPQSLAPIAYAALDRVPEGRAALSEDMLAYADTDLACYRAAPGSALAEAQAAGFDPLLAWLAAEQGVTLPVHHDTIMPGRAPQEAVERLRGWLGACDDFALAGLSVLVRSAGSLVLAKAFWHGKVDVEALCRLSHLEEQASLDQWGEDPALRAAIEKRQRDIRTAARFLSFFIGA